jgi:predicted Zn-dependent protease
MDSYALCPCGSGKKVKFCCQAILPEMSKIERLQQNNQPRMALQLIEKLLKDHSDNAWLNNQRAMALIGDERFEEARDSLVAFLRKNPDNPLSNGLLALAMTELEPIAQCKKVIHRAFLKSMAAEPSWSITS